MAQRTDRDAEFAAFLAADSAALTRAAREAGGGDPAEAAELLQSALVKTYLAWPRTGPDAALAHTRGLLGLPATEESPEPDPAEVPLDVEHLLAEGRNAARGRRMGWTVAGLASLAVVASILTPMLIASTVPSVPVAEPVTPSATSAAPTASAAAPASLLGTPWQVAGIEGVSFGPARTMTVQFDGGILTGFAGCNAFTGSYSLDGDQLRIDEPTVGAAGCSGRTGREESAFLTALAHVRSFRSGLNGPILLDRAGSPMVALIPLTPDAASWRLAGDAEAPSEITLTVTGDRLSGDTGCGAYAADLTRDGKAWTVSNAEFSSSVRCPRSANRRATGYLDLLGQITRAELGPLRLTLSGPDGELEFALE